ncbi:MAG: nucleotide exchange factor GrpE [Desulfobacterales bacterium]|nr:nucleotide exchange factor GrpE [Desulfobacterales bacterium]
MTRKHKHQQKQQQQQQEEAPEREEEARSEDAAAELAEVRQQLAQANDQLLRLAAEFDNTKKRLQREREVSLKYAEENLLREILPGLDNLERAMEQARESKEVETLLEGLEMTRQGLLATLEKFGVKQLQSIGEPFDPNLHEALTMEASNEVAANHVITEFVRGYTYKDRLLRPAKVAVSSGEDAGEDDE